MKEEQQQQLHLSSKFKLRDCLVANLTVSYAGIKPCISSTVFGSRLGGNSFMYKINTVFDWQFKNPHKLIFYAREKVE